MSHAKHNQDWPLHSPEGQLSVDVFRDKNALVIRSTVAGVKLGDLDISIDGDLLTIRGHRQRKEERNEEDWFYQECYWGGFSRSLILPMDVYAEQAQATLEDGVLTIRLPIRSAMYRLPIKTIESKM